MTCHSSFVNKYTRSISKISFQKLDCGPCCKFVMLLQYFTVISFLFFQPFLRGGPRGSSLGSYNGSSGHTGSLSSPRHYPQQFGTPLRSQGLGNKLDRTPARLGSILRTTEFLKLSNLVSFSTIEVCNRYLLQVKMILTYNGRQK